MRLGLARPEQRLILAAAVEGPGPVQLALGELGDAEELDALDRDRRALHARLDGLDEERDRELAAIDRRYGDVRELVFPFAVALCVPGERGR